MNGTFFRVRFTLLGLCGAAALAGCGGSGSSPSAAPAPAPSAGARPTTLVNAARGLLTVVLSALETARYYGAYVRPGVGLALGALPASPNPVCNPATHTAATSLPNQTGTTTLVTTAFYPASDATCSQAPSRILVMQYSQAAAGAQAGFGYEIAYALPGDPLFVVPGTIVATDAIVTTLYKTPDGSAALVAAIAPNGASVGGSNGPPAQPPAGTFPATFPASVPLPPPVTPFGFFFATAENGNASTTSVASLQGTFPPPPLFTNGSYVGHVAASGNFALEATPSAGGNTALSLVETVPRFATDVSNAIVPTVTPNYPFPSGTASLGIGALSPLAYRSSAANAPASITGSATYDAGGALVACSESATDPLDGVRVQAACAAGGAVIDVGVTDLLARASAIAPATVSLDGYGDSVAPFTFTFDGSSDSISGFVLQ